jgi:hypothetical protein
MSLDKLGEIGYYTKRIVQDSGVRSQELRLRSQESGKNFDNASAKASVATNCFTPSGQDVA